MGPPAEAGALAASAEPVLILGAVRDGGVGVGDPGTLASGAVGPAGELWMVKGVFGMTGSTVAGAGAWRRVVSVAGGVLLVVAGVVGCGSGSGGGSATASLEPVYQVSEATVSHETTQEISVFWPDAEGSWPVVHLFPGGTGNRDTLAILAETLAAQGVVVFVPDYQSGGIFGGPGPEAEAELVCAWRYGNSVAAQYGGDLQQPVTLAGKSGGAAAALQYGLLGEGNPDVTCLTAAPDPDVVVAIGTCLRPSADSLASDWPDRDAHVVLVSGSRDRECPPSGAEDYATALQSAGYDARFVEIDGGNHWNVGFQSSTNQGDVPGSPAGMAVVQTILDAIEAAR